MTKLLASYAETATSVVAKLRLLFDHAGTALAKRCAAGTSLDGKLLDANQVACYDLALASAELLAAEVAIRTAAPTSLEERLALTFVADAIVGVGARLDSLFLELELDATELSNVQRSTGVRVLRQAMLGSAGLIETAGLLSQSQADIGHVDLSEELVLVQSEFKRFADEVVAPQAESIHRHDLTVPESLLQPLREMGVFGLSIPERFGGSAEDDKDDNLTMMVVTEVLSAASLAAAGSLITRPEILSRALLTGGTEEQKAHWLGKIAKGDPLCAIGITEPDFGSDVAALSLKATRAQGGWLLNGAKTWCTFAGKAGLILVVARTDPDKSLGHRGLSVLLVEKPSYDGHEFVYAQDGGGRLTGKAIPTIGYRGMHSFDLSFEDFFVPAENVIGGENGLGKGFYFTMAGMVGGRMQTAARALGIMGAALRDALLYAADRKVFGAALLTYPLTQAKLVKLAARFAACRRLAYSIARKLDGGGRMEASLVKLFACRSAEWITRDAMQIFGAMGYAEETAVSRYFVDARVLSIFEGAEETLALKVIARDILEKALAQS
ncbi:MAG: acyl-CoA dehydrogenase family protein [Candidatus Paceibacterota bacterium]